MAKNRKTSDAAEDQACRLEPSEAWVRLHEKHPDHPAINEEATYALPPLMIDCLCSELPKLLKDGAEQFERELSEATRCGFFRRQPFSYPPLECSDKGPSFGTRRDDRGVLPPLRTIVVRSLKQEKRTITVQEPFFRENRDDMQAKGDAEEWRWAYASWLATNLQFKQDCELARAAGSLAAEHARFPAVSTSIFRRNSARSGRLASLYDDWHLESLATWELPIPMPLKMTTIPMIDLSNLTTFGVAAFIPWYMLRHRGFDLQQFADRWQPHAPSENLDEWFKPESKNWGTQRSIQMLQIYVYLELCLRRRYSDGLRNCLAKLDFAFARYFFKDPSGVETIRKIRLEMQKRLKPKKVIPE